MKKGTKHQYMLYNKYLQRNLPKADNVGAIKIICSKWVPILEMDIKISS